MFSIIAIFFKNSNSTHKLEFTLKLIKITLLKVKKLYFRVTIDGKNKIRLENSNFTWSEALTHTDKKSVTFKKTVQNK